MMGIDVARCLVSRKVAVCTLWAPALAAVCICGVVGLMIELRVEATSVQAIVAASNAQVLFAECTLGVVVLCLVQVLHFVAADTYTQVTADLVI